MFERTIRFITSTTLHLYLKLNCFTRHHRLPDFIPGHSNLLAQSKPESTYSTMAEEEQCSKCKMFPVKANNQWDKDICLYKTSTNLTSDNLLLAQLPPVSQPTTTPTILRHVWKTVGTILKDRTSIITVNKSNKIPTKNDTCKSHMNIAELETDETIKASPVPRNLIPNYNAGFTKLPTPSLPLWSASRSRDGKTTAKRLGVRAWGTSPSN